MPGYWRQNFQSPTDRFNVPYKTTLTTKKWSMKGDLEIWLQYGIYWSIVQGEDIKDSGFVLREIGLMLNDWENRSLLSDVNSGSCCLVHSGQIHRKQKKSVFCCCFFINNQTVFTILNKKYSKSHRVTSLVRILVLLQNIIWLKVLHWSSAEDSVTDVFI